METQYPLDSALEEFYNLSEKISTEQLELEASSCLLEQLETLSAKIKREAKKLANQIYGQQISVTLDRRLKDAQTCEEDFKTAVRDIATILRKDSQKRLLIQKSLNFCFKLSTNSVLFPGGNKQFGEFLFVVCTQLLNDIKPGLLQFEGEIFGLGPTSKIKSKKFGVGFVVLGVVSDAVAFYIRKCELRKKNPSLGRGDSESLLKILFTPVMYRKFCKQKGTKYSRSLGSSPLASPRTGALSPKPFT